MHFFSKKIHFITWYKILKSTILSEHKTILNQEVINYELKIKKKIIIKRRKTNVKKKKKDKGTVYHRKRIF